MYEIKQEKNPENYKIIKILMFRSIKLSMKQEQLNFKKGKLHGNKIILNPDDFLLRY